MPGLPPSVRETIDARTAANEDATVCGAPLACRMLAARTDAERDQILADTS